MTQSSQSFARQDHGSANYHLGCVLSQQVCWILSEESLRRRIKQSLVTLNLSLIVSLLHCLYEAKDPSLCQFVTKQLGGSLNLSYTSLTPVDCLAIGYFLSSVTVTTSNNKVFRVALNSCSLGDAGTKSLMCSIIYIRHIDPHSIVNTHLNVVLFYNEIHEESASHIAEVLNNTSIVRGLLLSFNPMCDKGLQTIFNSLKQNNTLIESSQCLFLWYNSKLMLEYLHWLRR